MTRSDSTGIVTKPGKASEAFHKKYREYHGRGTA